MVMRGERPPWPVQAEALGLTPAIWKLTKRCWHKTPTKWPGTSEILACLQDSQHDEHVKQPLNPDIFAHPESKSFSTLLDV